MPVVNTNIAETTNITQNGTYDVARYTTANVNVGGSKYDLLARVKDDTDKDIGCVVGYHTDANNQKYAVVCLNKEFRNTNTYFYLSSNVAVTNLPVYNYQTALYATETATFNCDKILAMAPDYTSSAVTECRNHSFVIDGITYYGQLPTIYELTCIIMNAVRLNTDDPSVSGPDITVASMWSSTQQSASHCWQTGDPIIKYYNKSLSGQYAPRVCPILEIPIN